MHTITIFGMKGGTGRTILTMALAAAMAAKGRRVAIADTTQSADSPSSSLTSDWAADCYEDGLPEELLTVYPVGDRGDLAGTLARAKQRGTEIALIDTQAHVTPHHAVAAEAADLVLVPFIGWMEAETVAKRLEEAGDRAPVFGVDTGVEGSAIRCRHVAALYGFPMLLSSLPRSQVLADIPARGRIDRYIASLEDPASDSAEDTPGFAAAQDMRHAWVRVQELATEVLWMLQGQMLKPAPVNLPPPAHAASCERAPLLI